MSFTHFDFAIPGMTHEQASNLLAAIHLRTEVLGLEINGGFAVEDEIQTGFAHKVKQIAALIALIFTE